MIEMGFLGSTSGKKTKQTNKKNLSVNAGDVRDASLIPGSRRSPRGGHGNPLQDSCLENLHEQRSLVGYSPRGHKELAMTEQQQQGELRKGKGN